MKTYPLYLNGAFVQSEPAWDVVNPATGEAFARICTIDRARLAQAIADAHAAFARLARAYRQGARRISPRESPPNWTGGGTKSPA